MKRLTYVASLLAAVAFAAPAAAGLLLGDGTSQTDCWVALDLPASFDGSRRVSCVDGDPACDADGQACPSVGDAVRRDATAVPPSPAWPAPDYPYPKTASGAVLAGTACAPATGTAMDATLGLPGPAAVLLPVTESWLE